MASQQDLEFTYSTIDKVFRLSIGETGDYSGAMYNGDFSLTLEEAQRQKHQFIVNSLRIGNGTKVLDMGCGWGPFLTYIKGKGAQGRGVTLSSAQAAACVQNGLTVEVKDCRQITPADYGIFDAVTCIGGLEHFCSIEQWQAGQQDAVYATFFRNLAELLPSGGRFYMQTMVFGKNMIDYKDISLHADKNSDSYALALMIAQFPGSWLPYGAEQVIRNAQPYFKLVSQSSGRLDYIETIGQWRKRFRAFSLKKYALYASLLPRLLTNKAFQEMIPVFRVSPNRVCFERETMDHFRLVFEKV
ncbi:SAM-dependent methyltransferase [Spirosoma utsteinense]|uniref:Cyclopropane-fatty-acyl-phospholipid synthase n=1 Tax=Spirosoma utsteinense TaxID=2585773 RepID=A0ABR6VZM2_9BACT|nr:class I SAM-dependent methyltransferase [Spirosoma utsteinense]MBC3784553.1 cyclopropane-fatty-acyl-phospholipid synthase [Spirosoma utsteinense]MBC3789695.1 cyclopropane-fatty-acyl-phospholipid synthase [Spirosoma utsteinense]